jgi:hypothetical protein
MASPCRHPAASATRSVDLPSSLSQIVAWSRVALPALTWLTPPLAPATLTPLHMLTGSHRSKGGAYDSPAVWQLESASVPEASHAGGSRGGVRRVPKAGRSGRVTPAPWTARSVFGTGYVPAARRQSSGDLPKLLQLPVSGDVTSLVAVPVGIIYVGERWLPPFDMGPVLEASRITMTIPPVMRDVAALLAFVERQDAVTPGPVGCQGYGMSGPSALAAAARYPGRHRRCLVVRHGAGQRGGAEPAALFEPGAGRALYGLRRA